MQTKLTLRLDDRLIARAKEWAQVRDVSLSQAVAEFFEQLTAESQPPETTWTRRLVGAARPRSETPADDALTRREYVDYLDAKHR